VASFSSSLEQALRRALQYANERSHEYATLEHLLLSLLDDRDAAAVMRACDVDLDLLRDISPDISTMSSRGSCSIRTTTPSRLLASSA
jgi:ATP-dependent Clp protease ATP-binding subunit ClpA